MSADLEKLLREGIDRLTADAKLRPDMAEIARREVAQRKSRLRPLRPLRAVIVPRRQGARTWRHRRRPRIRLIAPLAAATAMACVAIGVAVVGNGGPDGHGGSRTGAILPGGPPAAMPPYFVGIYSDPGNDLFSNLAVYDAS